VVAREHDTFVLAMLRYVKVTHALYGDCWWPQVSRLTFGVYLTHVMCVRLNYYSVQQSFNYTDYLGGAWRHGSHHIMFGFLKISVRVQLTF
jgi:hypothetical protein